LRNKIANTLSHLESRNAWPTWVLSNHDVPRHRQRYGGSEADARVAAVMLLTLPGTPFMYQGEELGLVDAAVDPATQLDPGGRDGCRAPLPWTAEAHHGWARKPWLPFAPEGETRNVATLQADPGSILHLYRELLALRHSYAALNIGAFEMINSDDNVLAYTRTLGDQRVVVALNLGDEICTVPELLNAQRVCATGEAATRAHLSDKVGAHAAVIALLT